MATEAASAPAPAVSSAPSTPAVAAPAAAAPVTPPAAGAKPATATTTAAKPDAKASPAAPASPAKADASATPKPDAKATEQPALPGVIDKPKEEPPAKDEVAETMARLNKEAREVQAEKKKLGVLQKELGDKAKLGEVVTAARAALGKKDFLGALSTLAGEAGFDPDEAAVLLLEQASSREKAPLTEEDVKRIQDEHAKAREEAERKAFEERTNAEMEQGKQLYGNAVVQAYKAEQSKYPLCGVFTVKDEDLFGWVIPEAKRQRGEVPAPTAALQHFESEHLKTFEKAAGALDKAGGLGAILAKLGYVKSEAATNPAATGASTVPVVPAPVANTNGETAPPKQKRETVKEYDARMRAAFRARAQAAQR